MHILGLIGRGLLLLLIPLLLAIWILLATLYNTILNKTVVFGWLNQSGAYSNVVEVIVSPQSEGTDEFLDQATLSGAISKTLSPDFVRQTVESVLNPTYDWLQGKSDQITFTIDFSQQRPELQKQLASAMVQEFKELPECTSAFSDFGKDTPTCIPKGSSPEQAAADLARRSVESTSFLSEPITQDSIDTSKLPNLTYMRTVFSLAPILLIVLPITVALLATTFIITSPNKFHGLQAVGRQIALTLLVPMLISLTLWLTARNISLDAFGDARIINNIVEPIAHQLIANISMWLFIFSGSSLAVGVAGWVSGAILASRNKKQLKNTPTPTQPPSTHAPS